MIKHYLIITIRSIFKDKIYTLMNILGLSISITCCFLLIFWIRFEFSFEDCYPKADRIYKVLKVEKRPEGLYRSSWITPSIHEQLKAAYPEIQGSTYVYHEKLPFAYANHDGVMIDYVSTNTDFLQIFSYEYIEGNADAIVKSKGCLITEQAAKKFFGNSSAIGKTLSFSNGFLTIKIAGVIKLPENTQVRFDILNPFSKRMGGVHYIMLNKKTRRFDDQKQKQWANFLTQIGDTKSKLEFQPLKAVHLHSYKELAIDTSWETYGNLKQIYLFLCAVLLILIIAVVNYINTSVAKAMSRMKEVGVRKINGSSRLQLIVRFLLESTILSAISVFIAMVFTKWFFPYFSQIIGNQTTFIIDFITILTAIFICLTISLLSGGYAAFYLSSSDLTKVLKGGERHGTKENLRKFLIVFQFFLSTSILTCTFIMYRQLNCIYKAETGVDRNNIIILDSNLWYESEDFIKIIKIENPNIIDATMAYSAPYNALSEFSGVSWTGSKDAVKEVGIANLICDSHYASVFGLEMLEGEFIPPKLTISTWFTETDEDIHSIVINETFKQMMGLENPIGTIVSYGRSDNKTQGRILGVVKDFNFKPLKEKITPLIINYNPESSNKLYIKTTGKDKQSTLKYILEKYKEMSPRIKDTRRPVMYSTVEDDYQQMYKIELRTVSILLTFSIISLILSLMGIISMVSFMIEKRVKEIAVRRINGAETFDVAKLFIIDFAKLFIIASIPAIPCCYIIMNEWLQSYIYRTLLSWWIFLFISALILIIISIVIAIQIYLTVRQNPVDSLRSE